MTISGTINFLESSKVTVFPTAYRNATVAPKARLNLEENFVSLGANGLGKRKDGSYVISISDEATSGTDYTYRVSLGGYYFELLAPKYTTETYLFIVTDLLTTSDKSYRIIKPLDGTTPLGNELDDQNSNFVGLGITETLPTVSSNEILHYVRADNYEDYLPEIQHDIATNSLVFGDATTSNIIPGDTLSYNLGAFSSTWKNIYGENIYTQNVYARDVSTVLQIGSYSDPGNTYTSIAADSNITLNGGYGDISIYASTSTTLSAADINLYGSSSITISSPSINLSTTTNVSGSIVLSGHLRPTTGNTYNLGTVQYPWNNIYGSYIHGDNINGFSLTINGTSTNSVYFNNCGYIQLQATPSTQTTAPALNLEASIIGIGAKSGVSTTTIIPNMPAIFDSAAHWYSGVDLGTTTSKFKNIYVLSLYATTISATSGNFTNISGFVASGTIKPYTNSVCNLGASDYKWYNIYGDNLGTVNYPFSSVYTKINYTSLISSTSVKVSANGGTYGNIYLSASTYISEYASTNIILSAGTYASISASTNAYISAATGIYLKAPSIYLSASASNTKLTTDSVGNASAPIYLDGGKPTACTGFKSGKLAYTNTYISDDDHSQTNPTAINDYRYWGQTCYIIYARNGNVVDLTIAAYDNPETDYWIRYDLSDILVSCNLVANTTTATQKLDAESVAVTISPRVDLVEYDAPKFVFFHDTSSTYKKYVYVCKDEAGRHCAGYTVKVTLYLNY